jgi:hypothetical protein
VGQQTNREARLWRLLPSGHCDECLHPEARCLPLGSACFNVCEPLELHSLRPGVCPRARLCNGTRWFGFGGKDVAVCRSAGGSAGQQCFETVTRQVADVSVCENRRLRKSGWEASVSR